ncbi:MAG: hypothetical protein DME49_00510 [Verrucomicrobia bacterium]|nr:MAG: hypothetical protein DME49_00510 [Verrucomicrobiota bacterium]PYK94210.1 MAG: hypothetical protein DME36_06575 [Verrucomicrobiota bacterium]PYL38584.1 MAG: hypothetical protein DMF34_06380 [Verrucomicrobiota bacterium]
MRARRCNRKYEFRCGLISITVILRDSFKFEKGCQLFVGVNDESFSVVAVRVCCEKPATSRINLRCTALRPTFLAKLKRPA